MTHPHPPHPPHHRTRRRWFDPTYIRDESRRSYRMALLLFWSILLYIVFERYVVGLGVITERSMLPTLPEDSYFLINKYVYRLHPPRRGDIVVVRHSEPGGEEETYVKRVIAFEGEMVRIKHGRVSINGKPLPEPYVLKRPYADFGPHLVAPKTCFVMGDNRAESEDSRSFGDVALDDLQGRIVPGKLFSFR